MTGRRRALVASLVLTPLAAMAEDNDRALIEVARRGETGEVSRLLAAGASVAARDGAGRTALLLATIGNHVEIARLLIEAGADVNAQDDQRDSPFLYAGAEWRNEILRLTLARGADLGSVDILHELGIRRI